MLAQVQHSLIFVGVDVVAAPSLEMFHARLDGLGAIWDAGRCPVAGGGTG